MTDQVKAPCEEFYQKIEELIRQLHKVLDKDDWSVFVAQMGHGFYDADRWAAVHLLSNKYSQEAELKRKANKGEPADLTELHTLQQYIDETLMPVLVEWNITMVSESTAYHADSQRFSSLMATL